MSGPLCSGCNAEYDHVAQIIVHDDACPRLAAMRRHGDGPCMMAAWGFCGCGDHS